MLLDANIADQHAAPAPDRTAHAANPRAKPSSDDRGPAPGDPPAAASDVSENPPTQSSAAEPGVDDSDGAPAAETSDAAQGEASASEDVAPPKDGQPAQAALAAMTMATPAIGNSDASRAAEALANVLAGTPASPPPAVAAAEFAATDIGLGAPAAAQGATPQVTPDANAADGSGEAAASETPMGAPELARAAAPTVPVSDGTDELPDPAVTGAQMPAETDVTLAEPKPTVQAAQIAAPASAQSQETDGAEPMPVVAPSNAVDSKTANPSGEQPGARALPQSAAAPASEPSRVSIETAASAAANDEPPTELASAVGANSPAPPANANPQATAANVRIAQNGGAKPDGDSDIAREQPVAHLPSDQNASAGRLGGTAQAAAATETLPALPAAMHVPLAQASAAYAAPPALVAVPLADLPIAIAAHARNGSNRFEIRLDPPELGRIDVRLDIDGKGNVISRLMAERPETLDLLRRDSAQIERALQDAGLKTGEQSLQFSLRQQASRDENTMPAAALRAIEEDDAPLAAFAQSYARLSGLGGGIDIRV